MLEMTFYKCENSNGLIIFPIPSSPPLLIFFLFFSSDVHIVFVPMDLLKVAKYLHHTSHDLVHAVCGHITSVAVGSFHPITSHRWPEEKKMGDWHRGRKEKTNRKRRQKIWNFVQTFHKCCTHSHTPYLGIGKMLSHIRRACEFSSSNSNRFFFTSKIVKSISMDMANHSRIYLLYSILFFVYFPFAFSSLHFISFNTCVMCAYQYSILWPQANVANFSTTRNRIGFGTCTLHIAPW